MPDRTRPAVNVRWWTVLALLMVASPWAFTLSAMAADADPLWQIAPPAGQPHGFLLGPAGYAAFRDDPVYVVGQSSAANDWPYVHPGPEDAWAGGRPHTFTVAFGLDAAPPAGGTGTLHLALVDRHPTRPPHLTVSVNGHDTPFDLSPGGADGSVNGDLSHARGTTIDVPVKAADLQAGTNVVRTTNDRGSWLLYDRVWLTAPPGCRLAALGPFTIVAVPRAPRGLIDRGHGRFAQPIDVAVHHVGADTTAVVTVGDEPPVRQPVRAGPQVLSVDFDPVVAERRVPVRVEVDGRTTTADVLLRPVRRVTVYVLNHSHNDVGFTDLQANVERKQVRNLTLGMDLARRTAGYPPGCRFVWNLECVWAADLYQQRMPLADRERFVAAVRDGQVAVNGMYANTLTGLCRPEELLQLFRPATELAKQTGVPVDSAMLSDVPGFSWGTVTAMKQAGIRYLSAAPNYFDRIGTIMTQWQDKPFWLVGPDGRSRVLVWVPWTGYAMSHVVGRIDERWVADYQAHLDAVGYGYDVACIRWAGHGDNAEPDAAVPDAVRAWDDRFAWPRLVISSTHDAFAELERRHGGELPTYRGDLTPYWEDGAASSAAETAVNRNTADRLVQAAALYAMRSPERYSAAAFGEAWRNVLLYSEHTWGAWDSVSNPADPIAQREWATKRAFAVDADRQSRSLLSTAAGAATRPSATAVDLFNTTSWPRSELVLLPPTLSIGRDGVSGVDGRPLPSQRLASGELAVWAADVPPLAGVRLKVTTAAAVAPAAAVSVRDGVLDSGVVRVRVDPATGDLTELSRRGDPTNYAANGINRFAYFEGSDAAHPRTSGPATVTVVDAGPLVATVRVESTAPGCARLTRVVQLAAGADFATVADTVEKWRATSSPGGAAGGDFAQRSGKESVSFAFDVALPGGQVRLDEPLSVVRPDADQLPGACKDWLPVGRWADVSTGDRGVSLVTLDAPLIEVGQLSALLGSQRNPAVWRRDVGSTQRLYSWVMNNHWSTNYRAYQEGPVTFRYALRPHGRFDSAEATRFAVGLSQPLLAVAADGAVPSGRPLLTVSTADVLVTTVKPADAGPGLIVRLFNASAAEQRATLAWPGRVTTPAVWQSNLAEEKVRAVDGEVVLPPNGLVTLRVGG